MQLQDATALVTGASSGIGAAIVRDLTDRGCKVAMVSRSREKLQKTADSLDRPELVEILPADVTDAEDIERAFDLAVKSLGRLDIVVNNAGFGIFKPIDELSINEFDDVMNVNLRGTFLTTRLGLRHLYDRGEGGAIVTISSIAGKHGFASGGAYCTSKFGVMGLMEAAFHEARKHDVRVITLTPGSVDTPFFDEAHVSPPSRDRILQPEDVSATVIHALSLPDRALIRELDIRPANPRPRD